MDEPERYAIYYEDYRKVADIEAKHDLEYEPHPLDYESRADATTLAQAEHIAEILVGEGHKCPRIYERTDITPDGACGYDWAEEFVKDID